MIKGPQNWYDAGVARDGYERRRPDEDVLRSIEVGAGILALHPCPIARKLYNRAAFEFKGFGIGRQPLTPELEISVATLCAAIEDLEERHRTSVFTALRRRIYQREARDEDLRSSRRH